MKMNNYDDLERVIGYTFKDKQLLSQALTHSSYANESGDESYERLEFLGDAVLELVVSEYVYKFNELDAGMLTKLRAALVSTDNLNKISTMLSIMQFVKKSRSLGVFSKKNSADIIESIIGAIYLDGGLDSARQFIQKFIIIGDDSIRFVLSSCIDYKTKFQEDMQKVGKKFEYRVISSSGMDHEKTFECGLYIDEELVTRAKGSSIRQAEEMCAKVYYDNN